MTYHMQMWKSAFRTRNTVGPHDNRTERHRREHGCWLKRAQLGTSRSNLAIAPELLYVALRGNEEPKPGGPHSIRKRIKRRDIPTMYSAPS